MRKDLCYQVPARAAWLAVFCGFVCAGGCSGKNNNLGGVAGRPVSGTVVYQGQPVAGATVTFKSASYSAMGTTDEAGQFKLLAPGREDSVPLGSYTVLVSKLEAPVIKEPTEAEQYQMPSPNAPPPAPPKDLLPAKYKTDPSGLSAEVTAEGQNDFKFELTD